LRPTGIRGNSRFEVGGVALAVLRMMQHRIDAMEDVPLRDARVVVVRAEFVECPVGDVLATVAAVLVLRRETSGNVFLRSHRLFTRTVGDAA
jgi:hypothetical protein